jgi:hypothetical protein
MTSIDIYTKAYPCDQLRDLHLQPEPENLMVPNSHGVEDSNQLYWVNGDT